MTSDGKQVISGATIKINAAGMYDDPRSESMGPIYLTAISLLTDDDGRFYYNWYDRFEEDAQYQPSLLLPPFPAKETASGLIFYASYDGSANFESSWSQKYFYLFSPGSPPNPEWIENIVKELQPPPVTDGGGCLIATAAFGSELAPQVQFLREIRDNTVLQTESGTSFMTGFNQFYYSFSPAIADYERENPVFKEAVKLSLTPLLTSLTLLQYADIDSESEMLGYGIGIIMLNVGMYLLAPAVVTLKLVKKYRKINF